jgi:hypothetical protein
VMPRAISVSRAGRRSTAGTATVVAATLHPLRETSVPTMGLHDQ